MHSTDINLSKVVKKMSKIFSQETTALIITNTYTQN